MRIPQFEWNVLEHKSNTTRFVSHLILLPLLFSRLLAAKTCIDRPERKTRVEYFDKSLSKFPTALATCGVCTVFKSESKISAVL